MRWGRRIFRVSRLCLLAAIILSSASVLARRQWREVRSPHFAVITDTDAKEGADIASRLEQMRAVFSALMTKANVNDPSPLSIIALRDTTELRNVLRPAGEQSLHCGLFKPGIDESFIVVDLATADRWHALLHEYAHELLNANTGVNTPAWFEEGFAEYFSTLTARKGVAKVGMVPIWDLKFLQEHGKLMHLEELFQVEPNSSVYEQNGELQSIFYAESWLLVHYLFDHSLNSKATIFFKAAAGTRDYRRAVLDSFGMPIERLEQDLLSYGKGEEFRYFSLPYQEDLSAYTPTARLLETSEAEAIKADISWHFGQDADAAVAEYGRVLHGNPTTEAALRGKASALLRRGELAEAEEMLRKALAIDPHDAIAHYLLASVDLELATGAAGPARIGETVNESNQCIAANPNFAGCYLVLSIAYRTAGDRLQESLAMSRAMTLSPRTERFLSDFKSRFRVLAGVDPERP